MDLKTMVIRGGTIREASQVTNPVTDNLAVSVDAGNVASYPGSGTVWTDISGNGKNGAVYNSTFSTNGGGAIQLNGTNAYVDFGNNFKYTSQSFSVEMSLFLTSLTTSTGGQGPIIFGVGPFQQNGGYFSQIVQSTGMLGFTTNQPGANQTTATEAGALMVGNWYVVCFTRNGSSVRIYVNGVDRTSSAATHINPTSPPDSFFLGRYNTASIFGNFAISTFKIYTVSLTQAQVTQNFNFLRWRFRL